MRAITQGDITAAVRGLEMDSLKLSDAELQSLVETHSKIEVFASQVIAEAARQILRHRSKKVRS